MRNFQYLKLPIRNETIAYRLFKNKNAKKTLILIHGNHSSQIYWDPIISLLQQKQQEFQQKMIKNLDIYENQLNKDKQKENKNKNTNINTNEDIFSQFDILTLDMKGFGKSSYNNKSENLEDLAEDIVEFIKILELKNVIMGGWSTGGAVSMMIKVKIPEIIKGILLVAGVGWKGHQFVAKNKQGQVVVRESLGLRKSLQRNLTPLFSDARNIVGMKMFMQGMFGNSMQAFPKEEYLKELIDDTLRHRSFVEINMGLHQFDFFTKSIKNQKSIQNTPTLIYHGKMDPIINCKQAQANQDLIGSQTSILKINEEAGHVPIFSHSNDLSQSIIEFLNQIEIINQKLQKPKL